MSATSTLDDAATLLGAASRTPDRRMRLVYLGEARIVLDAAGTRLGELRLLLDAAEQELARLERALPAHTGEVA